MAKGYGKNGERRKLLGKWSKLTKRMARQRVKVREDTMAEVMTLLEKAIAAGVKPAVNVVGKEEIDLVLAWIKGEITNGQVIKAVGIKASSQVYCLLALGLRRAYQEGKLVVK